MPSLTTILAGVTLAMGLALAGTGYWLSNVIESRALARRDTETAVAANVSLIKEAATAKAEAERNQAISATAIRDTAELTAKVAAIRERIRNRTACEIDPADAEALDGLFR